MKQSHKKSKGRGQETKLINAEVSTGLVTKLDVLAKKHKRTRKSIVAILVQQGFSNLEKNPAEARLLFGAEVD